MKIKKKDYEAIYARDILGGKKSSLSNQIFGINTSFQIKKIKKNNAVFGTVCAHEVVLINVKY